MKSEVDKKRGEFKKLRFEVDLGKIETLRWKLTFWGEFKSWCIEVNSKLTFKPCILHFRGWTQKLTEVEVNLKARNFEANSMSTLWILYKCCHFEKDSKVDNLRWIQKLKFWSLEVN